MMDHRLRTCCFTGHRNLPVEKIPEIRTRLYETVEWLIRHGVLYFGAGGAMGFDTLASQVVLELRKRYPEIKPILVLPCRDQTRGWPAGAIEVYDEIRVAADKVVYISDAYHKGCMHERNRHLVDCSGQCVYYMTESCGGTAYTVAYAQQNKLLVWNLADSKSEKGEDNVLQDV
ncbi:hypothetical protein SDC9_63946 [bioreactor metagenome]|uniref:DUF1273 domain-containing protein n=1 Tax=bioreactor metagenome TaxID=1076179 RepID=A0A644XN00_9ZZZZ